MARLEQAKRYPREAQSRSVEGVPQVRFSLDRAGKVLSASLKQSSGSSLLDAEAVAMIHRADPLPPPPPEIEGETIELIVPIRFSLCKRSGGTGRC
jgi:protein TonB